MSGASIRKCPFQWLTVAIALPIAFRANATIAQITPDSTLPNNSRVNIQDNIQTITGEQAVLIYSTASKSFPSPLPSIL